MTGFFFGELKPEDKTDDLQFIEMARAYLAEGYSIYLPVVVVEGRKNERTKQL